MSINGRKMIIIVGLMAEEAGFFVKISLKGNVNKNKGRWVATRPVPKYLSIMIQLGFLLNHELSG